MHNLQQRQDLNLQQVEEDSSLLFTHLLPTTTQGQSNQN